MKRLMITTAAIAAAFAFAAPAQATTYIGTRHVGAATAQLSITTDGTLGVLAFGNITDWTIGLSDLTHSGTLFGPLSGNNSSLNLVGSALSATANQLLFDFGGLGGFLFADNTGNNNSGDYCALARDTNCFTGPSREEIIFNDATVLSDVYRVAHDNIEVLGTAVGGPGGVPEPASWALMLAGFGLTGAAIRRRTKVRVTYA